MKILLLLGCVLVLSSPVMAQYYEEPFQLDPRIQVYGGSSTTNTHHKTTRTTTFVTNNKSVLTNSTSGSSDIGKMQCFGNSRKRIDGGSANSTSAGHGGTTKAVAF